jgi:hypothetical protein
MSIISDIRMMMCRFVNIQNELSWLLTDVQVSDIILGLLERKDYRQAAQMIESLNFRIANGNPDFFLKLWSDQQFDFNQVFNLVYTHRKKLVVFVKDIEIIKSIIVFSVLQ